MCYDDVFCDEERFGIVTYIIVGFVEEDWFDEPVLLDEIGISLLGLPEFSSCFNPDMLRTTLMLGVGTFVMRFEVWYVTYCLLRG